MKQWCQQASKEKVVRLGNFERSIHYYAKEATASAAAMVSSFLLLVVIFASAASGLILRTSPNADHLVVLTHGIMGTGEDLGYLASLLETSGCSVLRSVANENFKSLRGFKTGGEELASEIVKCIAGNNKLTRLSVVGNSLGGLYARYAMKILYNESDGTIAGLEPHRFMTIATPHLGVRNWTFVDDYGYKAPDIIKRVVSKVMLSTGKDIFGIKEGIPGEETLLFRMATEDSFLTPMRSFSERRLYANLNRDFVVPLGTAAFMSVDLVKELRKEHAGKTGIVSVIKNLPYNIDLSNGECRQNSSDSHTDKMIGGLNDLGWEKIIVNFPGVLPIAHNKICALTRNPKWLYNNVLGFSSGQFVMVNASDWLSGLSE